jgi:hypothetical protein
LDFLQAGRFCGGIGEQVPFFQVLRTCSETTAKAAEVNQTAIQKTNWIMAEIERKRAIWAARDVAGATKLAEPEAADRRRQASEQAKCFLLAEIECERAARAAAGDTRPTWISGPRVPEPERLAA